MKTRNQFLVSGVIAAFTIPLVHAAEPLHCNELFNDAQRLGCYDAVFGKPAIVGATANAPAAPVAPGVPATAPVTPVAPVAVGAAAATATAAAATAPASAAPKFAAKPEKFKAPITAVSSAADGRFIATLENGQQWLQNEKDSRVDLKVGETVTMEPMMFGSWAMVTSSGYAVRVKQLK